jgi:protein TIF31
MHDFGEAAVVGVKAIFDGQVSAMNPNEPTRSHVYLHNNIFFSRALDAGVETFKIAKGDNAARKSASRDAQCISALHRIEKSGLHTLATVMIDYLGTRIVCQSILPGILSGEKTHKLLFGAVEAGSPLVWDSEMHELLDEVLGKTLLLATRPLPRQPLSDERVEDIKRLRIASPLYLEKKEDDTKSAEDTSPTIISCLPIEAKGIRGSDQRKYVLDMTRIAPRDANWIAESHGGTGKWEALFKENGAKSHGYVPPSLDDDEWTVAVLRPEAMTNYCRIKMARYLESKKLKAADEKGGLTATETAADSDAAPPVAAASKLEEQPADAGKEASEGEKDPSSNEAKESDNEGLDGRDLKARDDKLTLEDEEYWKSLRLNVNVFLPDMRPIDDQKAKEQLQKDEECVREVSTFIWEILLPQLTLEMREANSLQIPNDGRNLTEILHQRGINCRYLGRLATLAQYEEERDHKAAADLLQGKVKAVERRSMPKFWLELLEYEMIARAAKHVLDRYLTENGGTAAAQPAQTIASFLSAMVSEGEETAAQTEMRLSKQESSLQPDDDDLSALTIGDTGGGGNALPPQIRRRADVWEDIEREVGRRFRYTLSLYKSSGKTKRALYTPLLRRICQRSGIRLVAKNYEVGGRCLCTSGASNGRLTASYPITPLDILDVVPLMKHTAAHGEGFTPCGVNGVGGLPSLYVSLPDAKSVLEAAHIQYGTGALPKALESAQEAASLYQRVTDTLAHPGVVRCIDVMAAILFDAKEPLLAASNATKALGFQVQMNGFDSSEVLSAHQTLSHILLSSGRLNGGIKHLRAAMYLMEHMAGPRYIELPTCYHRLGTVYHQLGELSAAIRFFREASQGDNCDRLFEGMIAKSAAMVYASAGLFKSAIESEKKSYHIFSMSLGEGHHLTKTSDQTLKVRALSSNHCLKCALYVVDLTLCVGVMLASLLIGHVFM